MSTININKSIINPDIIDQIVTNNTAHSIVPRLFRTHRYLQQRVIILNNKIKNIRDLHRGNIDFKDYQPRTDIVKDDKGDLNADSHSIWLGGRTISRRY